MSNEKMREEFETAAKARWLGNRELLLRINRPGSPADGEYENPVLHNVWWAWQQSRESMVIDIDAAGKALAESMDYPWEFMPEQGRARMKANARMVIEAAGLKVGP